MRCALILLVLTLVLESCVSSPAPSDGGILGKVLLGPTCPVQGPRMDCADKPYQATLTVLTPSARRVTRFTTEADGSFRVNLPPGDYVLHPETPQGQILPVAADQDFSIQAGKFTELTITYDTGIR